MSVLLSYVHGGMLHEEFSRCLLNFLQFDASPQGRHIAGGLCQVRGLYVADSRNQACRKFLEATYPDGTQPEWLLFLDTDIVFKPEDVYSLLDAADPVEKPIIGAMYFGYLDGKPAPVWRKIHASSEYAGWGTLNEVKIDVLEPIDAVGMGFTLIHRNVLTEMQKHYTGDNWTWFAHDLWDDQRLGEDITFCLRAAKLGFKTWGDSRLIVGHIKPFTIGLTHFLKAQGTQSEQTQNQ